MIDYEKVIHGLIDPLVEKPDSIMIRELPGSTDKDVTVLIVAEDDDTARLIGKKGVVANALREAIDVAGKADNSNLRIHLKFESFDEGKKKEDDAE
ncbi:MAG: KH domain-containing protein [Bacilli bacterium]